jgi:hypothetical protein
LNEATDPTSSYFDALPPVPTDNTAMYEVSGTQGQVDRSLEMLDATADEGTLLEDQHVLTLLVSADVEGEHRAYAYGVWKLAHFTEEGAADSSGASCVCIYISTCR